jgi:nitrous oxidase accessory protein
LRHLRVRKGIRHYTWELYFVLLYCIFAQADARTLVVGRDGAFSAIQQALDEAVAGDTIEVHSGTYDGNLVLDSSISLIGFGAPLIRGSGSGSIITVLANHCTLRGLVIEHSGGMLVDEDSGILLKSNGNRVEHNELRDVLYGIYLLASSDNQIVSNLIRGRPLPDLGSRGSGIHVWNSSNNLFVNNTITDARDGMYLQNAYYTLVRGNRIYGLRYGLHYMFSDDNTFEDNLSYNNVAGAAIMYSKRVQFRRNVFLHNRGFSSFGILFQDVELCTAEDNMISDNAVGVFMEGLRNSNLRHNLISANDVAIQLFQSASDNTFEQNSFVENLSPIEVIGGHTSNHWQGQAGGNYWSDYDGYDLDDDGFGDVPYRIYNVFQQLEGDYPRLRIFLYSPSAQALAVAERGFPVLRREPEIDEQPLMRAVPMSFRAMTDRNGNGHVRGMLWPALMLLISVVGYGRGVKR